MLPAKGLPRCRPTRVLLFISLAFLGFLFLFLRGSTNFISTASPMFFYHAITLPQKYFKSAHSKSIKLLINTIGCQINHIDIYDKSVKKYFITKPPIQCYGSPRLVEVKQNSLVINNIALKTYYGGKLSYCEYRGIHRDKKQQSDNVFEYEKNAHRFNVSHPAINVKEEFINVKCYNRGKIKIYENFHAFILKKLPPLSAESDTMRLNSSNNREKLNLVILGMDSVSRLNLKRMCPKTYNFITKVMNASEFKGYNKVAENTLVIMIPLFVGKFLEELPWDDLDDIYKNKSFDEYNFLWKNFTSRGYHTLFAEDYPFKNIFNTQREGFRVQPTEYYLRPFNLAIEKSGFSKHSNRLCLGRKLEASVVLDWIYDYLSTFHNEPHFAFTFLSRITHDYLEDIPSADEPYYNFLQKIHSSPFLNKTVFVFLSDHGFRYGDFRRTYVGKMEDRLPFLFIKFPSWFHKKYPQIIKNIQINRERLITAFDLHETFKNILYFDLDITPPVSVPPRGISLFNEIPENRTCKTAAILPQWCTCGYFQEISVQNYRVVNAAPYLLDKINNITQSHRKFCQELELDEIYDARQSFEPDVSLNSAMIYYQLIIIVEPGRAWFEGLVSYHEPSNRYEVLGDIIRINLYGFQARCIDHSVIKKYCICEK